MEGNSQGGQDAAGEAAARAHQFLNELGNQCGAGLCGLPLLGGFDVNTKKFFLICYQGVEAPLVKVVDLFKENLIDISQVTLPANIFTLGNAISVVSHAFQQLTVVAKVNCLSDSLMLVVVKKVWKDITKENL